MMSGMESPNPSRWSPRLALGAVLVLGAGLRLWQAGESLWIDELHTAWCAGRLERSCSTGLRSATSRPSFSGCSGCWCGCWGRANTPFRLPSLLAGSLLPLALYWMTARWTQSRWLGVLAAALVAVDRVQIFFATEARPYALIELVAVVHVAIVAELAAGQRLPCGLAL